MQNVQRCIRCQNTLTRARTHPTIRIEMQLLSCCASTSIGDTNNKQLLYVPLQIFSLSNTQILRESDAGKVHRVKLFCQIVFVLLPFHDKQWQHFKWTHTHTHTHVRIYSRNTISTRFMVQDVGYSSYYGESWIVYENVWLRSDL